MTWPSSSPRPPPPDTSSSSTDSSGTCYSQSVYQSTSLCVMDRVRRRPHVGQQRVCNIYIYILSSSCVFFVSCAVPADMLSILCVLFCYVVRVSRPRWGCCGPWGGDNPKVTTPLPHTTQHLSHTTHSLRSTSHIPLLPSRPPQTAASRRSPIVACTTVTSWGASRRHGGSHSQDSGHGQTRQKAAPSKVRHS